MKEVLLDAISHWGVDPQFRQAQEECAELITAISHFCRNRGNIDNLAEEIADVKIMIEQLELIFKVFLGEPKLIEKKYRNKMLRLAAKLEECHGRA